MADNAVQAAGRLGQSVWLDSISRSLVSGPRLKELAEQGISGLTSNPAIFRAAISEESDYDPIIKRLAGKGKSPAEIYDELSVKDIQDAASVFRAAYESSGGREGFVSLEVDPRLARKTEETVAEGKRLFAKVSRPNLMLKVPATDEGLAAAERLVAEGISVNITLIFCPVRYARAARAYMRGVSALAEGGGDHSKVRSVASVFVSRVDTKADRLIDSTASAASDAQQRQRLRFLRSKAAVANAAIIYALYRKLFDGEEFAALRERGVAPQRIVWGSTGTKDPSLSDIKYVEELVARDTISTLPEKTLAAFLDHGRPREVLTGDATEAETVLKELSEVGIDIYPLICAKLLEEGVAAFNDSFTGLLAEIERKSRGLSA